MDINLLIASDSSYLPHAVVALTSACENNRGNKLLVFWLHPGLAEADIEAVHRHFSRYSAAIQFIRVNDTRIAELEVHMHLTVATYYRVLCADLLPPHIDRVIYLDCDVIVEASLEALFAVDLGTCTVACVHDAYLNNPAWRAHLKSVTGTDVPSYFNSGVMVIDLRAYRASGVAVAAMDLLVRCSADLSYADQDALNVVLNGRWLPVHPRWNMQGYWYTLDYCYSAGLCRADRIADMRSRLLHPFIIHYTTSNKPWHFMSTHPLKQRYWTYRALTPYAIHRDD